MDVTRAQVLAYRFARQGLHRDATTASDLTVLDLGIQDAGARSPRVALAARLPEGTALDDDSLTTVWAHRGAPHLLRRTDLAALAKALWPRTDADAITRLGASGRSFKQAGVSGLTAYTTAATALRDVVDTEKSRGQVSTEITARLPAPYSYDCTVCKATHIYGSLFQLIGLAAGVEVHAESRPTTLTPLTPRHPVPDSPGDPTPVIENYLHLHGPAGPGEAAGFLETTQTQAKPAWPTDLVEVTVERKTRHLHERDLPDLRTPPTPDLVRLIPPLDPLLQARDRELLVPDEARRKSLWRMISNPGAILAGGEIAGIWRTKAAGKRLEVTVEPFEKLSTAVRKKVEQEAQVVAAARAFTEARVTIPA
ncbi:winged helix DNA-binding domain-containing protein [Actinokineospora sp. NBRC 105648]|uniref:winged helix DNA-binding domain-containing protein n=1 Tax=Actinokineospora sp. NBRC 105648 TaxID=3032206 RepID=UPI0024A4B87B|nr:winged helix DNA-binding domain-containing protein [Actinokineospora sp. NBRC 105648]GLZ37214.1 hypothetical protein Acsp05_08390 [Actinokineospora sp. NBRC 105648]